MAKTPNAHSIGYNSSCHTDSGQEKAEDARKKTKNGDQTTQGREEGFQGYEIWRWGIRKEENTFIEIITTYIQSMNILLKSDHPRGSYAA